VFSQYYFRGSVRDNHGDKLQYVKIISTGTKKVYRTDIYGGFGFTSALLTDTLIFSYDGYESLTMPIKATELAAITLIALPSFAIVKKNVLSAVIKNKSNHNTWTIANESYNSSNENPFLYTGQSPAISFSANINRASYSNIRRVFR
jgi:Ca-activated chloride channel family protein